MYQSDGFYFHAHFLSRFCFINQTLVAMVTIKLSKYEEKKYSIQETRWMNFYVILIDINFQQIFFFFFLNN